MPTVTLHRDQTGKLAGLSDRDAKAYAKFKARVGDLGDRSITFTWREPRSGPYHRRFFAMVNSLYESQDQFTDPEKLLDWLKVGAGHCDILPGPKGKPVAIPAHINWATLDQAEFEPIAQAVWRFARSLHATRFLWPMLDDGKGGGMVEAVLMEFGEQ